MSATTQEAPKNIRPPTLPMHRAAKIGQVVLWFRDMDPEQEPLPAIVTEYRSERASLSILDSNNQNLMIRTGVPHEEDERVSHFRQLGDRDSLSCGMWRHTADTLWLLDLRKSVAEAEAKKGK